MKKLVTPENVLILLILALLVVGVFIAPDYGWSTDERAETKTATVAYQMMTGDYLENPEDLYASLPRKDQYYGTASTVIFQFVENLLFPSRDHATKVISHYVYFLFFAASITGVYVLGTYFFDRWVALFSAALYGTQPLLFGHAFINPKDIPLLAVFLLTVVFGISMVRGWMEAGDEPPEEGGTQKGQRRFLITFGAIFGFIWLSPLMVRAAVWIVEYGLLNEGSLPGKILAAVTTYGSMQGYLDLTTITILKGFRWVFLAIPVGLYFLFRAAGKEKRFGVYVSPFMLMAAAMWGFSISTRIISIAAGGLVGIYALLKLGKKAVLPLGLYSLTASIFSFITWPFLWVTGLRGFLESIKVFSDFPWTGLILFEGQYYLPHDLPVRFVPKLLAIQFTEPVAVLAVAGLVLSLMALVTRSKKFGLHLVLVLWLVMPLGYIMIARPTIYNNFRHFLFITPPLFIFAGLAIEKLAAVLGRQRLLAGLIGVLLLVPGLVALVEAHPYQYVYYNSFVGGIAGAGENYELDYWNTAYKEAMDYVNAEVPVGSQILIWKNPLLGETYAEKKFSFTAFSVNSMPGRIDDFDYAIVPLKEHTRIPAFDSYPEVYVVEVDSARILAVVKIAD